MSLGPAAGALWLLLSLMAAQAPRAAGDAKPTNVAGDDRLVGGWFASTEIDGRARGHWLELRADRTWRRIEDHFGFRAEDHGRWRPDGDGALLEDVGVRLHLAEGRLRLVYRGQNLYAFEARPSMPKALDELPPFPTTLSETVAILTAELPERERIVIAGTVAQDLVRFHHGLGTYIRNRFGLWGPNPALRAACKVSHPDDASAVILRALRDHLRSTRPGGRELDHLEDVLQDLALAPLAIRQMTVAQLVTALNQESRRALRRKGLLQDALVFELARASKPDEQGKRETYWINHPPGLRAWGQGDEPRADTKALDLLVGFRRWLASPNRVMLEPTFDPRFYQTPGRSPDFASVRWRGDWFELETAIEPSVRVRVDAWSMLGEAPPMPVEQAAQYGASARERVPAGKTAIEVAIVGEPVGESRWAWSYVVRSALDAVPVDVEPPREIASKSMQRSRWRDLRRPPRISASAALESLRRALPKAAQLEPESRVEIRLKRASASAWYYELSLHKAAQRLSGYVTLDGQVVLASAGTVLEPTTAAFE